jgi:formylmethanofuran dehydrogenase subunit C
MAGGAATINLYGDWTQNSGATFSPGTSTINFRNTTMAQLLQGTASTLTFYNMVVNKAVGILLSTSGSITDVTANNFTNTIGNFNAPSNVTLAGTFTLTNGTYTSGATLTVAGSYTLTNGTFVAGANTNIGGNWSHATAATFTHSNGIVTFNGAAAQSLGGTKTPATFYDIIINKTAGTTLSWGGSVAAINANSITETQGNFTAPGTLTVSNNATITSGTFTTSTTATVSGNLTIVNGTLVAGATLNVQGDWVQGSGATFTPGLNTVNFTGGNAQSIQGTAPSITFYNLTINKTAGTAVTHSGSVASVTTNNFTNTQGNYTAPATLNVNGTYTLTNGTFTSGSNLNVAGNWSHATAATFSHNNGIVTFVGGAAQSLGGTKVSEAFYDLVINKSVGFALTRGGSIVTITARNVTQTQGDFNITAGTLTLTGNYTLTSGTFTAGGTVNLGGDWTHQSGATFTSTGSTLVMNGTGTQTIQGSIGTEIFNNLTITKTAGAVVVDPAITSLTVQVLTQTQGDFTPANTFNVNGNATFTAGTFTAGANMSFKGNISKAVAHVFNAGTSTTTFDGTTAQAINGAATSITFYNVVLNKGLSSALSFGGNVATITTNDFQHTLGTFTAPATVNINGTYTQGGGVYTAAATLNLSGNFTRTAGTFTPGTGTVKLVGTSGPQAVGGSTTTTFNNLQLNNTYSTSPQISTSQNLTVSGTLTLTSGIVDLSSNIITLGISAATPGTLSGGSSSAYLSKGTFNRWYNTTTVANGNIRGLFPVGDYTGNGYSPFYVTAPATNPTTGGTISASYTDAATNQGVAFLDAGTNIEVRTDAGWTVATANGLAGGTYNLSANRSFCAACVGALANLRITLASGVVGSNGTTTGTLTSPVVNRTGLTLANLTNTFYIGSTSYYSSPLPIELGDFKAVAKNGKVDLTWFTFSESENDFFTVERSKDGVHFEKVLDVDGAGNSSTMKNYSAIDANPFNGVSFYRLSQTDFNGDSKTCKVVSVRLNNTKSTITSVYPNPNDGAVIYADYFSDVTGTVNVDLVDVLGRKVYTKEYSIVGGETNSIMIQPNLNMMAGKYLVVVSGEAGKFCTQIMVK